MRILYVVVLVMNNLIEGVNIGYIYFINNLFNFFGRKFVEMWYKNKEC